MNGYDDKDTREIFDNVNTARISMKKRRKHQRKQKIMSDTLFL